jgi:sarcosine oxidase subunit alpha
VASISGPKAREILKASNCTIDLSNDNFEFMSFKNGFINDIPVRIFRISFTGELSFEINTPARYGLKLWETLMNSGKNFDLTPYGTESMHVLRAERGFIIVGQETDGSVSPIDLGMDWIISKKKSDFIGKRSLERISMHSNNRKELVGLLSTDPKKVIPEGAHAIETPKAEFPHDNILGHVTSSYYSPNCRRSIAMALIKGGKSKKGSKVWLPLLNGETIEAKVVNPVFFDPNGVRKNGI